MIGRFFRNAGVMAAAEIVARIKGVLILPLLTRYLGPLDYGVWAQASMIALLLSPALSLGSDQGLIRILPGMPMERQYRSFLGWMVMALGGAAICAVPLVVANAPISELFFGENGYGTFVILAAASLFTTLIPNAARTWLRIRNEANTLAASTVAQALLGIAVIAGAITLKLDVYWLVQLTLLSDLLLGCVLLVLILRRHGWALPDFGIVRPAVTFGLPLLPAAYAIWGLNWIDRIFLAHYATLEVIGIYAAAYGLGYMIIQIFVNPIWALYANSAAELHNQGDAEGVDRLLHTISAGILVLSVPAIAGMWVLSESVIVVVAGEAFRSGALIMPVIALGYLLLMLASFGDVALGLAYRQHLATVSMALAFVVNLVLNFVLVPSFGMMGAALATLFAFFTQLVFSSVMAARSGPFWRSFQGLYRICAAALIMGLAIKLADSALALSDVARLAVFIPAGAVLYGILALALNIVPQAYWKEARARFFFRGKPVA